MSYTKAVEHTIEIPLFDGAGNPITSGTPTVELSKDSAAYAAATNALVHVDEELWTLTITESEADCDRYRVRVTHDNLVAPMVYTDAANILATPGDAMSLTTGALQDIWEVDFRDDTPDAYTGAMAVKLVQQNSANAAYYAGATYNALPANFASMVIGEDGAVTTDAASREASKADVSELATSTELAAVQAHGDLVWATANLSTGANAVVIIVNDGTTALEGATVRVSKGVEDYQLSTTAAGQVDFSLDDGTWTVRITLCGYTFTPTTLVVSDDAEITYSMEQTSFPASDPELVTGYLYCYDEEYNTESGVIIQCRILLNDDYGISHDTKIRSETSDENGLVCFTNMLPGSTYQMRRGTKQGWVEITIPTTAAASYALPSILGEDE